MAGRLSNERGNAACSKTMAMPLGVFIVCASSGSIPFHQPCSPPAESTKRRIYPHFSWLLVPEEGDVNSDGTGEWLTGVTWTETWPQAGTVLYVLCIVVSKGRGWLQ